VFVSVLCSLHQGVQFANCFPIVGVGLSLGKLYSSPFPVGAACSDASDGVEIFLSFVPVIDDVFICGFCDVLRDVSGGSVGVVDCTHVYYEGIFCYSVPQIYQLLPWDEVTFSDHVQVRVPVLAGVVHLEHEGAANLGVLPKAIATQLGEAPVEALDLIS